MPVLLGSTAPQSIAVVIAAASSYVLLLLLVRFSRGRLVGRFSAADAALLLVLGAVIGREILGTSPTLGAAVLAAGVLVVLRAVLGLVARSDRGRRIIDPAPLLLIGGGRILPDHLRIAHIRQDELFGALRRAGVASVDEVACAVLESGGTISVTRHDENALLERRLFADVQGLEHIPRRFFAGP